MPILAKVIFSSVPNPVELYASYWKNVFNFNGRSKRSDYVWTSVIASLPLLIWMAFNYQWYLDYVADQVSKDNFLFSLPPGIYLYGAINLIPAIALNCRRLIDAGVDRRWLFAYFATDLGSSWVWCLALRPSFDADQSDLIASKAFERRMNNNEALTLLVCFLFPLASLYFGIRRRSFETALMPLAGAGIVTDISKGLKYVGGINVDSGLTYFLGGAVAALIMYFVNQNMQKQSESIAQFSANQ